MRLELRLVLFLSAAATLFAQPASKPTLRATVHPEAAVAEARISVEAADPAGLDTLTIDWPDADLRYETGLSGAGRFQRSFPVRDLFPGVPPQEPMRLTIAVRNTRGATADTTIVVRARAPRKGK